MKLSYLTPEYACYIVSTPTGHQFFSIAGNRLGSSLSLYNITGVLELYVYDQIPI